MQLILASCFYIALHFLLYSTLLRRTTLLRSEKGIFLFHLISVLGLAAFVSTSAFIRLNQPWPSIVAAVSIHGIYSITFLELWSLAEIGYSLRILEVIALSNEDDLESALADLAAIGDAKREERLAALSSFCITSRNHQLRLKPAGRIIAMVYQLIASISSG